MSNFMAFYGGHDANFCFYNHDRKEFLTIELEKLIDVKHVQWDLRKTDRPRQNPVFQLDYDAIWFRLFFELERNRWPTDIDYLITGSYYKDFKSTLAQCLIPENIPAQFYLHQDRVVNGLQFKKWGRHKGHHYAHAISAIAQMPPEKAVVLTVDGGGDDGVGGLWTLDRSAKKLEHQGYVDDSRFSLGRLFRNAGFHIPTIANHTPNYLDFAGKIMGAAGFGKTDRIKIMESHFGDLWSELSDTREWQSESQLFYGLQGQNNPSVILSGKDDWQNDANKCLSVQVEAQKRFDHMIEHYWPNFGEMLEKHDRQLIISGGFAMNILNNARVEKKYNCKVWVPPNPGDGGLAFGMLMNYLHDNEILSYWTHRFDNSTFGPRYRDESLWKKYASIYSPRKIDKTHMVKLLKEGKILALMQGRSETGFRALGQRSILCDPTIVTKDRINKVKRRETYRPFAPICLWKHADRYFEVSGENNYQHMNMAVKVKDKTLHAITHVDGTARLQAVDKPGFMYDLLSLYDGVLLNTSFNLSGKPICNSILHALHMLHNTDIDHLVIEHKNQLYLF